MGGHGAEALEAGERTRDLYERIASYPDPPIIPLPPRGDLDSLAPLGLRLTPTSRRIVRRASALSGFDRFHRNLREDDVEALLRRVSLRGAYLRAPVVSATLALADDARRPGPYDRAATLVLGARALQDDVLAGRLPADTLDGAPLEMGEYPNLFSTSLRVEKGEARVFKSVERSRIAVVAHGRLHVLDLGPDPAPGPLAAALRELAGRASALPRGDAGLLTAADHPTQLKAFRALEREGRAAGGLAALRHTLLTVCLDVDRAPESDADAAQVAHGGDFGNRWWHASLQLVVFGNGKACAICNFSTYLDGNVMVRGVAEIQRRAAACPAHDRPGAAIPAAEDVTFEVPERWRAAAQRDVDAIADPQPATFSLEGFGTDLCRARGLPAVPAFVLALQRAAGRLTGRTPHVLQFLAMSRWRCGDLVHADVTTPEVLRCVAAAEQGPVDAELLRVAMESQRVACRAARRYLPLDELLGLYLQSSPAGRRVRASVALGGAALTLRALGLLRPARSEIMISHPAIHPGVTVVGRPGVRVPHVRDLTAHFQVLPDRTLITLAASPEWRASNADLAAELRAGLAWVAGAWRAPAGGAAQRAGSDATQRS